MREAGTKIQKEDDMKIEIENNLTKAISREGVRIVEIRMREAATKIQKENGMRIEKNITKAISRGVRYKGNSVDNGNLYQTQHIDMLDYHEDTHMLNLNVWR